MEEQEKKVDAESKKTAGAGAAAVAGAVGAAVGAGSVTAAETLLHKDQESDSETKPDPDRKPNPTPQQNPEPHVDHKEDGKEGGKDEGGKEEGGKEEEGKEEEGKEEGGKEEGGKEEEGKDDGGDEEGGDEEGGDEEGGDEEGGDEEGGDEEGGDEIPELIITEDDVILRVDLDEDGVDDIVVTDLNENGQMDLLISSGMNGKYDTLLLDVAIDEEGNLVLDENGFPVHEGAYEVNAHFDIEDVDEDWGQTAGMVDETFEDDESAEEINDMDENSTCDSFEEDTASCGNCCGSTDYDPSAAVDEALLDPMSENF